MDGFTCEVPYEELDPKNRANIFDLVLNHEILDTKFFYDIANERWALLNVGLFGVALSHEVVLYNTKNVCDKVVFAIYRDETKEFLGTLEMLLHSELGLTINYNSSLIE